MVTATFTIAPSLLERIYALRVHPLCQGHKGDLGKIAELCMLIGMIELEVSGGDVQPRPRFLLHDDTWWLTTRLPPDDEGRAEALRSLVVDLLNTVQVAGPDGNGPASGPLLDLLALCEAKLKLPEVQGKALGGTR